MLPTLTYDKPMSLDCFRTDSIPFTQTSSSKGPIMREPEESDNAQIASINAGGSVFIVIERLAFETVDQKRERLFLDVPIDEFDLSTENLSREFRDSSFSFLEKRFG